MLLEQVFVVIYPTRNKILSYYVNKTSNKKDSAQEIIYVR